MLDVKNLECIRGDRPLFSDLSFALGPGQLFHITGANGSGKTTLLRTLCGLSMPAVGEIRWQGMNITDLAEDYHQQLIYIGHNNGINGELSALENLATYRKLWPGTHKPALNDILAQIGLNRVTHLPAKHLSQGQKRRIALARLLLTDAILWILDEPLTALDTTTTDYFSEVLSVHLDRGGMIVITSHQELTLEVSLINKLTLS